MSAVVKKAVTEKLVTKEVTGQLTGRLALRRERLLEEGEHAFLSKGYAGASVNEIVRQAGGSLATLYSEFGSKEGLFAEIMRRRAGAVFDCNTVSCPRGKSPRSALINLASRLLQRRLSEDSLALYRIAISEGPRFPELRKVIVDVTFPAFIHSLANVIVDLNLVKRRHATEAAEEFISLVHGQLLFRAACGAGQGLSPKMINRHVERAIDAFLALHPPLVHHALDER